jgi:hypothetical protein
MAAQLPRGSRHSEAQTLLKDFLSKNYLDPTTGKSLYKVVQDPSDAERVTILRNDMRGQELTLNIATAHKAPIGWGRTAAGNKSLLVQTKYGTQYVMGATGIGSMQGNRPKIQLQSPIESLGNLINASFLRTQEKESSAGVMKQFQYGMQHGIPKYDIAGGLQQYTKNQRNSQALGVLSSDLTFMFKTKSYTERVAIQKELERRMRRPSDPNWSGLEAHVPREPTGNVLRFRAGGEISRHGTATRDTLLSVIRGEKQAYGAKYLTHGTRNQLTPIVESRQSIPVKDAEGKVTGWKNRFMYNPMKAENVTQASFRPLGTAGRPKYVKWNAVYGGEDLSETGELIPQQSLAGSMMFAPTLYSGAGIVEGDLYKDIYGAQYQGQQRAVLRNISLQDLLEEEKGITFTEQFKQGGMFRRAQDPRGHGTIGFINNQRIKLPIKRSDYLINQNEPLRMVIPQTFRKIDKGPDFEEGKSTEGIVGALQKRYPNMKVEVSPDVEDVTIMVEGGQIIGFSEKGTLQRTKSGIIRGHIGTMKQGGVEFRPNMVTGEAKSLPWAMGASFGLQPYENQIELLKRVDPELARRVSERYAGQENPVINVPKVVSDLNDVLRERGELKPEMRATTLDLWNKMLKPFMSAGDQENAANLQTFGIGRTGEQWVSTEASSDTRRFFQNIIKNKLQQMYPEADAKQVSKLARTRFRFKKMKDSDNYIFSQKTSGMLFQGVMAMSEEFAGDVNLNYEAQTAIQSKFPQTAHEMGIAVEQGPIASGKDPATKAWASAHRSLNYAATGRQGRGYHFSPKSMVMMNQEKAEEFMAHLQVGNYDAGTYTEGNDDFENLPNEQQIGIYKEAFEKTFPGADPMSTVYMPKIQKYFIPPAAAEQIGTMQMGVDVSQFTGKFMRAFEQGATAEKRQDPSMLRNFRSIQSYEATLGSALAGEHASSVMKRLMGRKVKYGASYRYVTADFLEANEGFLTDDELKKLGLNVDAINAKIEAGETIPMVLGRYPSQDRLGAAIAMKLTTEKALRARGVKDIPTSPTPGRKGDPSARDTMYVSHLFSRLGEGDIDKDELWAMLGLKDTTKIEEVTKGDRTYKIRKKGYEALNDPALMKEINAPMKQKMIMMDMIREKSFGQYAQGLDVYGELVKSMMIDPFAEATKSAKTGQNIKYEDVYKRAEEINIMNKAGMGKSYNIRRQLEAQMSMIGTGYGNEDVGNMYLTSKYTYQQYLDLLRKKKEGFSPLEELLQTANITPKRGRISAKVSGKPNTRFWDINMENKWDLSGFLMGEATEATASNQFLSYLFGAGKEGSDYIMSQIGHLNLLKANPEGATTAEGEWFSDLGNMVPDTGNLNKRNEILSKIMREGKYINESSPINRMLTERVIEKARTKGTLGEVSHYKVPWKGQATPISDVIKDPDYIRQSTAYRLLKRNAGGKIMSADELYEVKKMANEKIAKGVEPTYIENMAMAIEDINQFEAAKELFDLDYGARQATMVNEAQFGVSNLVANPVMHASEIARTAREVRAARAGTDVIGRTPNYRGIQGLSNIITRSIFGRDVMSVDNPIFGEGEHYERLLAEQAIKSDDPNAQAWKQARQKLGSWIGGRQAQSGLYYMQGNTRVEANPDFFNLEDLGEVTDSAGNRVRMTRPLFTEAKSRNPERYEATKQLLAGEQVADPRLRQGAMEGLQESLTQAEVYEKAFEQTFGGYGIAAGKLEQATKAREALQQQGASQQEIDEAIKREERAKSAFGQAGVRVQEATEQLAGEHLAGHGLTAEQLATTRKHLEGIATGEVAFTSPESQTALIKRNDSRAMQIQKAKERLSKASTEEEQQAISQEIKTLEERKTEDPFTFSIVGKEQWRQASGGTTTESDIRLLSEVSGNPEAVRQVAEQVQTANYSVPAQGEGLGMHSTQEYGISTAEDIEMVKGTMGYVPQVMNANLNAIGHVQVQNQVAAQNQINNPQQRPVPINPVQPVQNNQVPPTATGAGGTGGQPPINNGGNGMYIPMPSDQGGEYNIPLPGNIMNPQGSVGSNYIGPPNRGGFGGGGDQDFSFTNSQEWRMMRANEEYQKAVGMYEKFTEGIQVPGQEQPLPTIETLQKQLQTVTNNILGTPGADYNIEQLTKAVRKDPSQFQQSVNMNMLKEGVLTAHQARKALGALEDAQFPIDHPFIQEMIKIAGPEDSGITPSTTGNLAHLSLAGMTALGIGESPVNDKELVSMTDAVSKSFEKLDIISAKLTGTLTTAQKETDYFQNTVSKLNDKQLKKLQATEEKEAEKNLLRRDIAQQQKELEQIRQQPAQARETGKETALSSVLAGKQGKLQGIMQEEEDIASGKAGMNKFASSMRKLVGGWGLFYMKTLATMGMGSWAENYQDVEQYLTGTQEAMGKTMGAGVGIRPTAATALHRARIRGGAGAFEQLQQMQAGLADTALGDVSGAALTGVGWGILSNYVLGALGLSGAAALPIAAGAGVGALAYNRYATAISPTAPIQVGSRSLAYQQSGRTADALDYAWQGGPTLLFNPEGFKQGEKFGQLGAAIATGQDQEKLLYEEMSRVPFQKLIGTLLEGSDNEILSGIGTKLRGKYSTLTTEVPKTWEDVVNQLGGDKAKIAMFNQMFAANEDLFEGYSPEILANVFAEQQVLGTEVDLQKIKNIAGARQLGIDTSGLAGAMVSQFGATLPSGEYTRYPSLGARDNYESLISQLDMQQTDEVKGGLEFLSQLSNSGYLKERLAGEVSGKDLEKIWQDLGRMDVTKEQLQQIAITQKASEYMNLPQGNRIVTGLSLDAMMKQAGLIMPETDIDWLRKQSGTSMSPEEIRQVDTANMVKNMATTLQTSLTQTTNMSTGDTQKLAQNFINIASNDLVKGLEYMNRVNLIQNKNPYIISEMFAGKNEDLVSVDINAQGQATGLPLYTTNVSEAQASRIWGADWEAGDKTGLRSAAVRGIDTKIPEIGTLKGIRGIQWLMQQTQWEYQQQSMDIAGAQVALQREYLPKFWDVQDRQRALSHEQQLWSFGQQESSMAMSQRQASQSWGLQAQGMQMNQDFARQGWAYQDKTRNLQWGWKVEDFQENVRFMTGRERRLAERQMGRETTMHNLEGTQIDKQRQQQEEIWDLQEQQFEMTKEHFAEQQKFQEEALEKQKEFYDERKRLEDESIALQREYQLKQLDLQGASVALQREQAEKMHDLQIQYEILTRQQDDQVANWQMISLKEMGFVETALLGLDTFTEIRDIFKEIWGWVSEEDWKSPLDVDKAVEGIVGEENMYKALGGVAEPAQIVGEVQQELLISPDGGTIIPVSKIKSPWSDQVYSNVDNSSKGNNEIAIVKIYIGNKYLGDFIIDTVEKEIRV